MANDKCRIGFVIPGNDNPIKYLLSGLSSGVIEAINGKSITAIQLQVESNGPVVTFFPEKKDVKAFKTEDHLFILPGCGEPIQFSIPTGLTPYGMVSRGNDAISGDTVFESLLGWCHRKDEASRACSVFACLLKEHGINSITFLVNGKKLEDSVPLRQQLPNTDQIIEIRFKE